MKKLFEEFIASLLVVITVVIVMGLPLALAVMFANAYFLLLWIISLAIYITVLKRIL